MDITGVMAEDNTLYDKILKNSWLVIAAYFVGNCQIYGINPFFMGFLISVFLLRVQQIPCFVGIMLGLAGKGDNMLRYYSAAVLVMLVMEMNSKEFIKVKKAGTVVLCLCVIIATNFAWFLLKPGSVSSFEMLLEVGFAASMTAIFYKAIGIILEDNALIAIEDSAGISAVILASVVLYGMPIHIFNNIVVAETFYIFAMLYAIYRYGFGIGVSFATVGGIIMALRVGEEKFVPWILVIVISAGMLMVAKGGRIMFGLIFIGLYYMLGFLLYPSLVTVDSNKAVVAATIIFLLLPPEMLCVIDKNVKAGDICKPSTEWANLVLNKISGLADAFKRIDYIFADDGKNGIGFLDVGNIIEGFSKDMDNLVPLRKTIEAKIVEELSIRQLIVKSLVLQKTDDGIYTFFITVKAVGGRMVVADTVRKILEQEVKMKLIPLENNRAVVGNRFELLGFTKQPEFVLDVAVKKMNRYKELVSGDDYYIGSIGQGRQVVMLADGMGSGKSAALESEQIIDAMQELLTAGFDKEMTLRVVNSYFSNLNRGERFATLDMLLINLHTGLCSVYKQGAAATFIKRDDRIEVVKSTSLPIGVKEGKEWENCEKKLYDGNVIVMASDGVFESIVFENKDEFFMDLIIDKDEGSAEELATGIVDELYAINGNKLQDDATVIVCKLVKTL